MCYLSKCHVRQSTLHVYSLCNQKVIAVFTACAHFLFSIVPTFIAQSCDIRHHLTLRVLLICSYCPHCLTNRNKFKSLLSCVVEQHSRGGGATGRPVRGEPAGAHPWPSAGLPGGGGGPLLCRGDPGTARLQTCSLDAER